MIFQTPFCATRIHNDRVSISFSSCCKKHYSCSRSLSWSAQASQNGRVPANGWSIKRQKKLLKSKPAKWTFLGSIYTDGGVVPCPKGQHNYWTQTKFEKFKHGNEGKRQKHQNVKSSRCTTFSTYFFFTSLPEPFRSRNRFYRYALPHEYVIWPKEPTSLQNHLPFYPKRASPVLIISEKNICIYIQLRTKMTDCEVTAQLVYSTSPSISGCPEQSEMVANSAAVDDGFFLLSLLSKSAQTIQKDERLFGRFKKKKKKERTEKPLV